MSSRMGPPSSTTGTSTAARSSRTTVRRVRPGRTDRSDSTAAAIGMRGSAIVMKKWNGSGVDDDLAKGLALLHAAMGQSDIGEREDRVDHRLEGTALDHPHDLQQLTLGAHRGAEHRQPAEKDVSDIGGDL